MAKGVYVPAEIIESEAYTALGGVASQVLLMIMLKRRFERVGGKKRGDQKKTICVNGNELTLTYIEAEKKYRIRKSRFIRALDDLLEKGFITCTHRGGAYKRDKSTYALSDRYQQWKQGVVFEIRQQDSVSRGFRHPKKRGETKISTLVFGTHTLTRKRYP
jgi:hypothetical protein